MWGGGGWRSDNVQDLICFCPLGQTFCKIRGVQWLIRATGSTALLSITIWAYNCQSTLVTVDLSINTCNCQLTHNL